LNSFVVLIHYNESDANTTDGTKDSVVGTFGNSTSSAALNPTTRTTKPAADAVAHDVSRLTPRGGSSVSIEAQDVHLRSDTSPRHHIVTKRSAFRRGVRRHRRTIVATVNANAAKHTLSVLVCESVTSREGGRFKEAHDRHPVFPLHNRANR